MDTLSLENKYKMLGRSWPLLSAENLAVSVIPSCRGRRRNSKVEKLKILLYQSKWFNIELRVSLGMLSSNLASILGQLFRLRGFWPHFVQTHNGFCQFYVKHSFP